MVRLRLLLPLLLLVAFTGAVAAPGGALAAPATAAAGRVAVDEPATDPAAPAAPGGQADPAPGDGGGTLRPTRPELPRAQREVRGPTARAAWTAQVLRAVTARAKPSHRARPVRRLLTRALWWGGPEVLLVLGARTVDGERWLDVLVKGMPAGSHGWIPADATRLRTTDRRIVVDVSARTLVFQRAGRTKLRTRVVVGAPGTPTPIGQFAVDAVARVPLSAQLGPRVLAVVAYSRTLAEYDGGLPQTAIHASEYLGAPLGTAASHGCVRAPQRTVDRLLTLAPRGTPVLIRR